MNSVLQFKSSELPTESSYSVQTSSFTNSGHVLAGSSWMVQRKDSSFINTHWRGYKSISNGSKEMAYLFYVLTFSMCYFLTQGVWLDTKQAVLLLLQLYSQQRKNSNDAAYSPSSSLLSSLKKKPQNQTYVSIYIFWKTIYARIYGTPSFTDTVTKKPHLSMYFRKYYDPKHNFML